MSFVDGNLGTWPKEKRFVTLLYIVNVLFI